MFESKKIGAIELEIIKNHLIENDNFIRRIRKNSITTELIFVLLCGIASLIYPSYYYQITLFIVIVTLILIWGYCEEYFRYIRNKNSLNQIIDSGIVYNFTITTKRFYQLPEVSDFGEYYLFEIEPNKTLYVGGQEYYPSEDFPNSDFEMIEGKDDRGRTIIFEILNKGNRIYPIKMLSSGEQKKLENLKELKNANSYITVIHKSLEEIDEFLKK